MSESEIHKRLESPITVREASELRILQIISENDAPVGSRVLRQQLLPHGIDLSEATVGRWLSELTERGYLEGHGRQGRVLTDSGKARLENLQTRHDTWARVSDLFQMYEAVDPAHLLDLLHARRLIEPEIARLAALRATDKDLERIATSAEGTSRIPRSIPDGSCSTNSQRHEAILTAQTDSAFHMAVAQGAHSPALATTVRLLRSAEPHFPIFVRVREYLGHRVLVEHQEIAAAISSRDADLSQDLMYRHIDGVLSDVEHYAFADPNQEELRPPERETSRTPVSSKPPQQLAKSHRFTSKFPVKATVFASMEAQIATREVMLAPSTAHVVRQGDIAQVCIRVNDDRRPYTTVREIALVEMREAGVLSSDDDVVVDNSERLGLVAGFDLSALPQQVVVIIDAPAGDNPSLVVRPGALVTFRG